MNVTFNYIFISHFTRKYGIQVLDDDQHAKLEELNRLLNLTSEGCVDKPHYLKILNDTAMQLQGIMEDKPKAEGEIVDWFFNVLALISDYWLSRAPLLINYWLVVINRLSLFLGFTD